MFKIEQNIRPTLVVRLLPMMGISFWFILAFPFGNRNEGFVWAAYFEQYNLFEILINPIPSIINYRPLAQLIAWILYFISGNNIILVQLVNFALLAISIFILVDNAKGDKVFLTILFFLSGLVYISTYYYIFNLHGIFYSPILLFIAVLIRYEDKLTKHWIFWLVLTLFGILFHPFLGILYLSFLAGHLVEKGDFSLQVIVKFVVSLILLFVVTKFLNPDSGLESIQIDNLLGSMRNVEANGVIMGFSLGLCFLSTLGKFNLLRLAIILGNVAYIPFALALDLPFLFLLSINCLLILLLQKRWALLGLLISSIFFPLIVKSGAPTKTALFIFLMPFIISSGFKLVIDAKKSILNSVTIVLVFGILLIAVASRVNIDLPVVSKFVRPILVERGKTIQLQNCIALAKEELQPRHLEFLQRKEENIRDHGQSSERAFIPPAKQEELDTYMQVWNRGEVDQLQKWYLSFGTADEADSLTMLFLMPEINNSQLYVYTDK